MADGKGNLEFEYSAFVMIPVTQMPPGAKFPVTSLTMTKITKKAIVRLVDVTVQDLAGNKIDNAQAAKRLKEPTPVVVLVSDESQIDPAFKSIL